MLQFNRTILDELKRELINVEPQSKEFYMLVNLISCIGKYIEYIEKKKG